MQAFSPNRLRPSTTDSNSVETLVRCIYEAIASLWFHCHAQAEAELPMLGSQKVVLLGVQNARQAPRKASVAQSRKADEGDAGDWSYSRLVLVATFLGSTQDQKSSLHVSRLTLPLHSSALCATLMQDGDMPYLRSAQTDKAAQSLKTYIYRLQTISMQLSSHF